MPGGLHERQDVSPLGGHSPAAADALDQPLRKDVEVRHSAGKTSSRVGPIAAAGRQDGHVALEVLHDGKAVRIAHQDLQYRNLEIQRPRPALVNQAQKIPLGMITVLCFGAFAIQNVNREKEARAGEQGCRPRRAEPRASDITCAVANGIPARLALPRAMQARSSIV